MNRAARATVATVVYVGAIVAANVMTDRWGLVPIGFGLVVTAGTFAAGFALLARDFVHREGGLRLVLAGIAAGSVISWVMASPALALASCVAFTVAELVDLAVFQWRRRGGGFVEAALVSNLVSAPVDTVLFLAIAGLPLTWQAVTGQFIAKIVWATVLPLVAYVGMTRAVHGDRVHAEGA